jgi:hypothetical protein
VRFSFCYGLGCFASWSSTWSFIYQALDTCILAGGFFFGFNLWSSFFSIFPFGFDMVVLFSLVFHENSSM